MRMMIQMEMNRKHLIAIYGTILIIFLIAIFDTCHS